MLKYRKFAVKIQENSVKIRISVYFTVFLLYLVLQSASFKSSYVILLILFSVTPAGSPFKFHVDSINSGYVTAYGAGLVHGITGEPCNFTISTKDAGAGSSTLRGQSNLFTFYGSASNYLVFFYFVDFFNKKYFFSLI